MAEKKKRSRLTLEDGSRFYGYAFGYPVNVCGEVVFNTGMVGYPESLTDPSYKGQILVLTYPLIGNYGVPDTRVIDGLCVPFESDGIKIGGLIISQYSYRYSHWNAVKGLDDWLKEHHVPGLYDVDTRRLTKHLRKRGTLMGRIIVSDQGQELSRTGDRGFVPKVSIKGPRIYKRGRKRVVVIDCGCKNSIIRSLLDKDVTVIRVPWDYDFFHEDFDGILISNGPGDPKLCQKTIKNIKRAVKEGCPILGICLGSQILALAVGADTYKLKFGHRSQNQPCIEVDTRRCYITSQNHGYAVDNDTLPDGWEPWFINANDSTNEGIRHRTLPLIGVQFHPEASPGPVDTSYIFDEFVWRL